MKILAVIVAIAVFLGFIGQIPTAQASHSYTIFAVHEVHIYRHLLETNDRFVLFRYGLIENPGEGEVPYGVDGAVLSLRETSATVAYLTPPFAGYALAAFYQPASVSVTWGSANVDVLFQASPTIFTLPQTAALGVAWHATANTEETIEQLTVDLVDLMTALETQDPEVQHGDYVGTGGITEDGVIITDGALPNLRAFVPDAFENAIIVLNNGDLVIDPGTGWGDSAQATALSSPFSTGLLDLGDTFGVGQLGMGIIVFALVMAMVMGVIKVVRGTQLAALVLVGPALLYVGKLGLFTPQMVGLIILLVWALGLGLFLKKFLPQ